MRILISSGPLYGHVNTLLPLALAAQRAGYQVVIATGAEPVPHVERRGLHAWPVGPTHAQAGGSKQASWLHYFAAAAHQRAADLVPRAMAWRPALVIALRAASCLHIRPPPLQPDPLGSKPKRPVARVQWAQIAIILIALCRLAHEGRGAHLITAAPRHISHPWFPCSSHDDKGGCHAKAHLLADARSGEFQTDDA